MAQRPQGPDFKAQAQAARADFERQLQEGRAQFDNARAQFDEVNERIRARTGRNLILAILIGLGAGVLVLGSLIFVTELFMVFAAAAIALAVVELGTALRASGRDIPRTASVIAALAVVPASYYLDAEWRWVVTMAGIAFVVLWRVVEYAWPSRRGGADALLRDITASILVLAYVGLLASFAVLLASPSASPGGKWWLIAAVVVVVATDTGAYAAGLNFGRHKMAPEISPGKTWEGFAGAGVAAIVAGILLSIFMIHVPWWFGFVLGPVLLFTATIGDLAESLIKRDIGIKDMSGWLPGHGGVLDRLDSILPSMAATYALYLIFYPLFS
ncbi:phosphatidate cytidylyltransferase [Gryllotalpicola protaetiae]|uniref:Phosphatidate cytidylyltransferase n=1 Tax=Gryllotalpicola protaetiae TaxID=2419771 RepID=A0A387BUI6_9MICO|nr:phosphatidate cytidylyltransferase [Gryllotalpicola protaetiae]AYG02121.1 phosphatidate cytidylyltransferase [Gryllotalpicola protaetiae]